MKSPSRRFQKPVITAIGSTDLTQHITVSNRNDLLFWIEELIRQCGIRVLDRITDCYKNPRKPSLRPLIGHLFSEDAYYDTDAVVYISITQKKTHLILVMDAKRRAKAMKWILANSTMISPKSKQEANPLLRRTDS